jgi:hypothetical protein
MTKRQSFLAWFFYSTFVTGNLAFGDTITALYVTSSPESWVGGGATFLVTPADGFEFSYYRSFDYSISFAVNDFQTNPDSWSTRWWYLDIAAPLWKSPQVGSYPCARRYPFQGYREPGLSFMGNGRGNNVLTGSFEVLEATYAADDSILALAFDFIQFDEGIASWWNVGSFRYNSTVPLTSSFQVPVPEYCLPEPSSCGLLCTAIVAYLVWMSRRPKPALSALPVLDRR